MLGKWPIPNKLSGKVAPAAGLWIRGVLVRAQEGRCPVQQHRAFIWGAAFGSSPGGAMKPTTTYLLPGFAYLRGV
jgi:hypothetical protein